MVHNGLMCDDSNSSFMQTSDDDVVARVELACRVCDDVRRLALEWFQSPKLQVMRKADGSVVTSVDKKAEEMIREAIQREFPGDGVLGEEFPPTPASASRGDGNVATFRWILDPIDGTSSFVRGIPHFVTLIGIERDGDIVGGLIDAPALGERVSAARGGGALWTIRTGETRPAHVSDVPQLRDALIEIGPMNAFERNGCGELHRRLCLSAKRNRGWSDGYAFMLVATGRVDAAVHLGFNPWDLAGPLAVIEEAGGQLTDWSGQRGIHITRPMASNGALHAEMVKAMKLDE